jgi:HSP20 family protein
MMASTATPIPTQVTATPHPQPATTGPFQALERFADGVNRIFDELGLGRGGARVSGYEGAMTWAPRVDVSQHKGELIIRADLPGVEKDDVKINVTEDTVTIHGERHRAQEEERDGVYRTERSFGAFYRSVALPPGTASDQAKASFKDGVLEIRMPAAPGAKGRPLAIGE